MDGIKNKDVEGLKFEELTEIVELVRNIHEFDFSNYSNASLKRRFERLLISNHWDIIDLKTKITNEPKFLDFLIREITVNVTEMFRDPDFYNSLILNVLPYLESYQRIKVWNAGVSSGEELYSFTILFKDSNLYKKSFFYGTDINTKVLEVAKNGIYPIKTMKLFAESYTKTNLKSSFSEYFTTEYQHSIINSELKKNCLFSVHNLISDSVFNEFQLVSCRNVLIYFDQELQLKVVNLLIDSLCLFGFLCLGSKEVIRNPEALIRLKVIDSKQNIYQKIK
ncbi:MAG: CheR family methyltransferase [Pelobium sp.]